MPFRRNRRSVFGRPFAVRRRWLYIAAISFVPGSAAATLSAISLSRSATSIIIELDGKRECEDATSSTHEHLHNMFRLELSRSQIVGFRRRVGSLDERLPVGPKSLRRAAWAGLQDSMPRAALLSLHARVEGAGPTIWEHPSLVQLWGLRFSAYVVAAKDLPVFSLGRLPGDTRGYARAHDTASRLHAFLNGRPGLGHGARGQRARCQGLSLEPRFLRLDRTGGETELREEARDATVLHLEHTAYVGDDRRRQYGPGAVGVGWDMALMELAKYLESGGRTDPAKAMEWLGSPEGKDFIGQISADWCRASIASGTNEKRALTAAARTTAAYTGQPEPPDND